MARATASNRTLFVDIGGPTGATQFQRLLESNATYATDWYGVQLYLLRADILALGRTPEAWELVSILDWSGRFLRLGPPTFPLALSDHLQEQVLAVRTQFNGFYAYGEQDVHPQRLPRTSYSTFTTRFFRDDGQELGLIRYFGEDRVVTWSFTNGQEGVAPEWRVPGGFNFDPNLGWAGIQAMEFQRSRRIGRLALAGASEGGSTSAWSWMRSAFESALSSIGSMLVAPVGAQSSSCDGLSDGCTGLHWLDDTVFVECCNDHDLCYEVDCNDPCTKWSWIWPFGQWNCVACNADAVLCFFTSGEFPEPDPGGGGGGEGCDDGDPSTRCSMGDYCPAECQSCTDPY